MRKLVFLTALALVIMALLSWVNCSNPLEPVEKADPTRERDTIFRTDTIYEPVEGDTLIITDTLVDTVIHEDTLTIRDTIYIPEPGTTFTICSIIHYNLNELIWTFNNPAGSYNLLFTVTVEREFSFHELIITIDDDEYSLFPAQSLELRLSDIDLPENVTIRIKPDVPLLLGHQVDVCLGICALED